MTAVSKIILFLIISIFVYNALIGAICLWYREGVDRIGLPSPALAKASDNILMGGVVLITVLLSSQIGKRMGK